MMRRYRWFVFLLLLPLFLIDGGQSAPAQVFPTHQAPVRFPNGVTFPIGRYPATATASPLTGFYTSFWKMVDLTDSVGSLTLTNSATPVVFSAGLIGNAGTWSSDQAQFLRRAAVAFTGPSFTISLWMNLTTGKGATRRVQLSWNGVAAGSFQITTDISGAGVISFYTDAAGGAGKRCDSVANTYADSTYHLIVASHDGVSKVNSLWIDNGTVVTMAATADVANASAILSIGNYSDLDTFPNWGQIDAVGIADNKTPTSAQITAMWHAGVGAEPPF
jgi:hypothetical protein